MGAQEMAPHTPVSYDLICLASFTVAKGANRYLQKRRSVPEKSTRIRNGPHATFHQPTIQNSQASHPFAIVENVASQGLLGLGVQPPYCPEEVV